MQEEQPAQEKGPLPRTREAVDWWLKKWGRELVLRGFPLVRDDLERLIEVNGGKAEALCLVGRDLRNIDLKPKRSSSNGFQRFDLRGAFLRGADFRGAVLWNTDLRCKDLAEAKLHDADLTGACLQEVPLTNSILHNARLREVHLQGADLREADLQGADLSGADLRGANLAWVKISPQTNLEGSIWDKNYVSVLEREGYYEAAIALYRRLKEWYRGAGMLKIAGEFHYREREAQRKAGWQQLGKEIKQFGDAFKEFKGQVASEWKKFRGEKVESSRKAD